MGRGRQKAKHQKVARELKYHTSSIDVTALERELAGDRGEVGFQDHHRDTSDSDDDPYGIRGAREGADEDVDELADRR